MSKFQSIAIYSRKSKFTGKGESINNQIELCRRYMLDRGYASEDTEFLFYEDEGFFGGNTHRPAFQHMIVHKCAIQGKCRLK